MVKDSHFPWEMAVFFYDLSPLLRGQRQRGGDDLIHIVVAIRTQPPAKPGICFSPSTDIIFLPYLHCLPLGFLHFWTPAFFPVFSPPLEGRPRTRRRAGGTPSACICCSSDFFALLFIPM